jgi:hypothetical protein
MAREATPLVPENAPRYHSLSIGFHREESLRALALAPECSSRTELRDRIVKGLRQRSRATRRGLANKLIQRYLATPEGRLEIGPFAELVSAIRDRTSRTQLLFYRLTQVDEIVGALAREVLYPYFIEHQVPAGFRRDEFQVLNGQRLLDEDPYLLTPFVVEFAKRNWGVSSPASLGRALGIVADAELVCRRRVRSLRRHPHALAPTRNDLTTTTFLYALYDEFGSHTGTLCGEALIRSQFARTLLTPPDIILNMVDRARHYGFLRRKRKSGELSLTYSSLQAAMADLKETAV